MLVASNTKKRLPKMLVFRRGGGHTGAGGGLVPSKNSFRSRIKEGGKKLSNVLSPDLKGGGSVGGTRQVYKEIEHESGDEYVVHVPSEGVIPECQDEGSI